MVFPSHKKLSSILFLLLCASMAWGQPSVEQVKEYLEGYEWKLQPSLMLKLGADTDLTLMQILEDPASIPNYYHFRALEALRLFKNERVAIFLEGYIIKENDTSKTRRAYNSYFVAFSDSKPAKVESLAALLMQGDDPALRLNVAQSLQRLKSKNSKRMLQTFVYQEKEAWVKKELEATP